MKNWIHEQKTKVGYVNQGSQEPAPEVMQYGNKIAPIQPQFNTVPTDWTKVVMPMRNPAYLDKKIPGMKTTFLAEYNKLSGQRDSLAQQPQTVDIQGQLVKINQLLDDLYNFQNKK